MKYTILTIDILSIKEEKINVAFYNIFIWTCTDNLKARFKHLC